MLCIHLDAYERFKRVASTTVTDAAEGGRGGGGGAAAGGISSLTFGLNLGFGRGGGGGASACGCESRSVWQSGLSDGRKYRVTHLFN